MQHILLLKSVTSSSITKAGQTFQTLKLQEYDRLGKHPTSKQISKFQEGIISISLSIFKPDSMDTAFFRNIQVCNVQNVTLGEWMIKQATFLV